MAKHWTSPRTGVTYNVTSRDSKGNWDIVSAPHFGSLTALAAQAAFIGGMFLVAGLFLAFGVALIFVGISMAIARWFVVPPVLCVACLALLALPEGRRRWYVPVTAALFSLFVLLPLTFVSMYLLANAHDSFGSPYAWAASIPLVPAMFLAITVWLAVRRSWLVLLFSLFMAVTTGIFSLMPWLDVAFSGNEITGPVPPAASTMAMDNILSVLTYGVVLVILTVVARQISLSVERSRMSRAEAPDALDQSSGRP